MWRKLNSRYAYIKLYLLGKCDNGLDPLHCLYEDPTLPITKRCTGEFVLMEIPKGYKCNDQVGQFKCVRRVYQKAGECERFCPGTCKKGYCS